MFSLLFVNFVDFNLLNIELMLLYRPAGHNREQPCLVVTLREIPNLY